MPNEREGWPISAEITISRETAERLQQLPPGEFEAFIKSEIARQVAEAFEDVGGRTRTKEFRGAGLLGEVDAE